MLCLFIEGGSGWGLEGERVLGGKGRKREGVGLERTTVERGVSFFFFFFK